MTLDTAVENVVRTMYWDRKITSVQVNSVETLVPGFDWDKLTPIVHFEDAEESVKSQVVTLLNRVNEPVGTNAAKETLTLNSN